MTQIDVNSQVLTVEGQRLTALAATLSGVAGFIGGAASQLDWDTGAASAFKRRIRQVADMTQRSCEKTRKQAQHLIFAAGRYERAEAYLVSLAGGDSPVRAPGGAQAPVGVFPWMTWYGIGTVASWFPPATIIGLGLQMYGIFGGGEREWGSSKNGGSVDYWGSEHEAGSPSWTGYGARTEVHGESGAASGNVKAHLGKVDGEWTPFASEFSDGRVAAGTKVGASVSALNVGVEGEYGDKELGVYGEAGGDVLTAKAEAMAGVFQKKDGTINAGVKGEVGAAVAEGRVEGGFMLGGLKIGVAAEGKAIAVGAEGQIGIEGNEFKIGAGLSALFGGGFELTIGW